MHTNTDLFVEYTSFLEKSVQKMDMKKDIYWMMITIHDEKNCDIFFKH